ISDVTEAGGEDLDGDGAVDDCDDSDGDGVCDSVAEGLTPIDTDGTTGPDFLDLDADADGITDAREAGLADADRDGRIDDFVDDDLDGASDEGLVASPRDTDRDGVPDYRSNDSDGDAIADDI